MTASVQQIRFSNWGDPNAPRGYFATVDYLAHVIGNELMARYTKCDSYRLDGMQRTTIMVDQMKEKFGEARVYCTLAHPALVLQAWKFAGHADDEPSHDFRKRCYLKDIESYRGAYLTLCALVPQYRDVIVGAADHSLFLASTKDEANDIVTRYKSTNWLPWRSELVTLDEIYDALGL